MEKNNLEFLSAAAIDSSGLLKTIQGATQGTSNPDQELINILDFLSLVEGIVLHDKLVASASNLGYYHLDGKRLKKRMPNQEKEGWDEIIQPLVDAGVVYDKPIKSYVNHNRVAPDFRNQRGMHSSRQSFDENYLKQDAWYETGRIISLEQNLHIAALPMIRQRQIYELEGNVPIHHAVTNLVKKYEEIKKPLMEFSYDKTMIPSYGVVKIPPLALEAISRSTTREGLIESALDLRTKYKPLRESLRQLRQDLADDNISRKEKAKVIKSWSKSWETLTKYEELGSLVTVAHTTTGMLDIERERAEKISSAVTMDVDGFVSNIFKLGVGALASWRVRVLHNTARQFINTSNSELALSTERLFNRQLNRRDLEKIDKITQPYNN